MSYTEAPAPRCTESRGRISLVVEPKAKDLGGFTVRRVLPAPERRMVGPFVFFDEMGPAEFPPGQGIQVRPHPHIGLATLTYLFEGEIMHRDSLGYAQPIRPGAVNLMTAGRGIVHSERAGEDLDRTARLHGIQTWLALPTAHQETEPAFVHHPVDTIPELALPGGTARVVVGEAFGARSPVAVHASTFYVELRLEAGATIRLPEHSELGFYVVAGAVSVGERSIAAGAMGIAEEGASLALHAEAVSHVVAIGGEPLGRRHLWWNFVSDSRERIEQAKADWRAGRFPPVPGDDEFIPLPE